MKRTGPSNPVTQSLIFELKKKASTNDSAFFGRLAYDLEKPTRKRRVVNLSRLNRYTQDGEVVVVPGKVLGSGALDHSLTIYAFDFSEGANESIKNAKAKALRIEDLLKLDVKGKKIRIMG